MKPLNPHNARLQHAAQVRIRRILRMREAGKTWQEIGDKLAISKQRAQTLAARGVMA